MKKNAIALAAFMAAGIHAAVAQTRTVSGKVVDEKNEPYIGATVVVKGTTSGTQTDADGNFTLTAPAGATLVIRAVGYNDQEISADGNLARIRLTSNVKALNETVVTALGIRKEKKRVGYTATDISGETLERSVEQNVVEALAAKAPGTQVTGSAGTPGASAKILLRGNTSLSGDNQPLFVVDGIPFDNSTAQPVAGDNPFNQDLSGVNESNRAIDINPNDVESVTVLRGPAAAALYGARGGNGAIIITTKKGRYGQKRLGVNVSTGVNIFEVNKLPNLQNKYIQGNNGKFSNLTPNSCGPRADTAGMPIFDNPKKFFQTGVEWTNNVSLDGGSEKSIFRLGFGNTSNKGVVPSSRFDRFNVNFSGETKLADWLKVGAIANYVNSSATRVQNGSNVGGIMLTLLRAPINYNSDYYIDSVTGKQVQYFSVYDNPRFTTERNPYTDVTNRVYGSFYTNIDFTPSLSLNWRLGADNYTTSSRQIYDIGSRANGGIPGKGEVSYNQSTYTQVYSDLILRYNKQLSADFDVSALAGYNVWDNKAGSTYERGRNLQIADNYNLANTSSLYASNSASYLRTQGAYSEVTVGYRSRLFATISGRSDWSTAFGKGGRSTFYPKAEMAWVFSESIKRNNILSYGKIRAAYADVGNGIDVYTYSQRPFAYYTQPFITDGYTDGNSFPYLGQAGYAVSNTRYPGGLVPAHTEGIEAGLELRLFRNRLNFEATVYRQITSDNLIAKPVAGSTGFQAEYVNAGEVQNQGIELSLNADVVKTRDFTWNLGGNFSKNVSKVLSLTPGVSEISLESGFSQMGSYAIVGQPYGVFYGTAWKRNDKGQLLLDSMGRAQVAEKTKNLGNPNPDWLMNLSTTVNYKGFYASALLDIRHGGYIWNGTYARLNNIGRTEESADREHQYLIQGVYDSSIARAGEGGKDNKDSVSANYYYRTFKGDAGANAAENAIQNGGWIRLRSLNVGYRFNIGNQGRLRQFNYIDLSVTGRNLFLITDYKGVDPETSLTGAGSNIGGWDYFNNPGTRSYSINLRVGF